MNKVLALVLVLLYSSSTQDFNERFERNTNDSAKTIAEYLLSYGYNFEEHKVITPDGYILTLWRIPKKIKDKRAKRMPILLQHGVLDCSMTYLHKRIDHNLAIILVNEGYDVWLGNNRGTLNSLEHINSEEYDWSGIGNKYWDFSFDQMGQYDFPAMIDYICDITGFQKIMFAGHSQGATQFFIKGIIDEEYINEHFLAMVGLAPVLFIQNIPGLFEKILNYSGFVDFVYNLGIKNFWTVPSIKPAYIFVCKHFPRLVRNIVTLITGQTKNQTFDLNRLHVMAVKEPGGTSTQNLLHWVQLMRSDKKLRRFDYGKEGNIEKYDQEVPPEYDLANLQNIKVPLYLFAAKSDNMIAKEDFESLLEMLPENTEYEYIDDYGHLDYIWADDAHVKIYPQIIDFLKKN